MTLREIDEALRGIEYLAHGLDSTWSEGHAELWPELGCTPDEQRAARNRVRRNVADLIARLSTIQQAIGPAE